MSPLFATVYKWKNSKQTFTAVSGAQPQIIVSANCPNQFGSFGLKWWQLQTIRSAGEASEPQRRFVALPLARTSGKAKLSSAGAVALLYAASNAGWARCAVV